MFVCHFCTQIGQPIKYSREEFISAVRGYCMNLSGLNHTEIIQGVLRVLQQNLPGGEITQIIGSLPEEFHDLFEVEALTQ